MVGSAPGVLPASTHSVILFSSRIRHTRYWRDWSSDVCSSDLPLYPIHESSVRPVLFHPPLVLSNVKWSFPTSFFRNLILPPNLQSPRDKHGKKRRQLL